MFIMVVFNDPGHSEILLSEKQCYCNYLFKWLRTVAAGIRTYNRSHASKPSRKSLLTRGTATWKDKKKYHAAWTFWNVENNISDKKLCNNKKNDGIFSVSGRVSFIRNCIVIFSSQLCSVAFRRVARVWSVNMLCSYYVSDSSVSLTHVIYGDLSL